MRPGMVIADRFELERPAGAGGMGTVYRARDRTSGAPVALKLLHAPDGSQDNRFVREVRALEGFHHPAIARYVAHGMTPEGERYLATEWLEGEDLAQRLERGPVALAEALVLASRVAEALAAAHARGIVHRDLKPANLFLPSGDPAAVRLLDFGVARLRGTSLVATATGMLLGTPGYMAPEQARTEKDVDARADVFALGCVLFECLTGRPAFAGEHVMAILAKVLLEEPPRLSELRAEVPPGLEALLVRMLAKEREGRPADGSAVAAELAAIVAAAPVAAAPAPPVALTSGEQHLFSVVLVQGAVPAVSAVTETESWATPSEVLAAVVEPFGGQVASLADGSLVVALAGRGAATDQAARAARCALALQALLPGARIALATGLGAGGQLPAGEVIDRAAVLLRGARGAALGEAGPGATGDAPAAPAGAAHILLDDVAAGLLEASFGVERGHQGAVLLSERELEDPARRLLGRESPTVGRDRELQTLGALFDECVEDSVARAALVTAPAGTGKSRIRHEFVNGVRKCEKPVVIWLGRGDPISAGSPFGMIAPAIRRAAGILDGEPLALRQAKLRVRLARHLAGAEQQRVTEFLGELIGVPFADDTSIELKAARQDARLMGDQMMRAWQDWLAAEAAAQPVLIVLEDLHWGDPPTVSFTDAALRHLKDRPLMVLALARPEVHEVFPKLWAERGAQEIRLGELTRRASEKLVREALGEVVPAETVARIVELSSGNAFYLEELIRAVAEGREEAFPETVLAMVEARLSALEPEARRILRAASVFGGSFWRGGVAALLGSSEGAARIDDWLAELAERELVTPRPQSKFTGEREYQFRHELVRVAAYAMLTEGDRALGHRLAGEWLERSGEAEPMVLAEHFERGGEPARALGWFQRAAQQSLEGNDLAAAVERAERAVARGAVGETLGALRALQAEAECWRGRFADAARHAGEAMDRLPHGGPAWASAGNYLQWAGSVLGRPDIIEGVRREMLNLPSASEVNGARIVTMACLSGGALVGYGDMRAAAELLEQGEQLLGLLSAADPIAEAQMAVARGFVGIHAGDPSAYLVHMARAAERFESAGDLRQACLARGNQACGHTQIGEYREAVAALRECLVIMESLGLDYLMALARENLALALLGVGELEEARTLAMEGIDLHRTIQDRRQEGATVNYLAMIELAGGNLDAAARAARRAVDLSVNFAATRVNALTTLARALLARGRPAEALAAATEAMQLVTSGVYLEEGEVLLRLTLAEALAANGRRDEAAAAIRAARDLLGERAAKVGRTDWRESFLNNVPENARTLALAREWLVGN